MSALPTRTDISGTPSNATAKTALTALFDFAAQRLAAGTSGAGAASAAELQLARDSLQIPLRNYLHNPDGAVYQRTIAATADDVYAHDRWYVLTETASVTPSQVSNPEDGYRYAARLTQSQSSSQRMGRAQIVEGIDTSALRGKTVTVGGRFKLSAAQTLRYALLAWTGTEDAVTSDVVNSWSNGTFTTGQFFNSTTLSLIATGSTALSAATAATCSVSGTVPSNATNLIFVYWTEAVAAQNVTLDSWAQRLVESSFLAEGIRRTPQEELAICMRFYEYLGDMQFQGYQLSGAAFGCPRAFLYPKRATPTVAGSWAYANAASGTLTGVTANGIAFVSATASSTASALFTFNGATASAEL